MAELEAQIPRNIRKIQRPIQETGVEINFLSVAIMDNISQSVVEEMSKRAGEVRNGEVETINWEEVKDQM